MEILNKILFAAIIFILIIVVVILQTPPSVPAPSLTPVMSPTPSSTLYIDQIGIKGDGTDEGAKLQTALNYAASHSMKTVVFPEGMTITIAQHIDFPEGLTVIGNGCTLKLKDHTHDDGVQWGWIKLKKGVNMSGMRMDGNRHNGNGKETHGIQLCGGLNGNPQVFTNNEIFGVQGYTIGVYANDGVPTDIHITNNTIYDSGQYGISTGCTDGPYCYGHNVLVDGNTIYSCAQVGVKIRGTVDSVISNNTITVGARTLFPLGDQPSGIRLYSWDETNTNVTISDNRITGLDENPSTCIDSDDNDNHGIRITGNTISHCHDGIDIQFNNGIITGNTISDCVNGIINDGSNNTISNNNLTSQYTL